MPLSLLLGLSTLDVGELFLFPFVAEVAAPWDSDDEVPKVATETVEGKVTELAEEEAVETDSTVSEETEELGGSVEVGAAVEDAIDDGD